MTRIELLELVEEIIVFLETIPRNDIFLDSTIREYKQIRLTAELANDDIATQNWLKNEIFPAVRWLDEFSNIELPENIRYKLLLYSL